MVQDLHDVQNIRVVYVIEVHSGEYKDGKLTTFLLYKSSCLTDCFKIESIL